MLTPCTPFASGNSRAAHCWRGGPPLLYGHYMPGIPLTALNNGNNRGLQNSAYCDPTAHARACSVATPLLNRRSAVLAARAPTGEAGAATVLTSLVGSPFLSRLIVGRHNTAETTLALFLTGFAPGLFLSRLIVIFSLGMLDIQGHVRRCCLCQLASVV